MRAELIGRDQLLADVATRIDALDDRGGAVVFTGEPGIGKSALTAAAASRGRGQGLQVVEYLAVPSEARLPYAGMASLIEPFAALASSLPGPQPVTIDAVLGRTSVAVAEPTIVPFAILNLLREAAADAPILIVIDDLQWLDEPSASVIRFVARRIARDPILLLASSRDAGFAGGIDEVQIVGLDGDAAEEVVRRTAPTLSAGLRQRLVQEAAGNPLALTELALAWSSLPPGTVITDEVPITARLTGLFSERLDGLSAPTRDLLLVAALDGGTFGPAVFAAATALSGEHVDATNVDEAIAARLLRRESDRVRCHHPLVPAAVRDVASLDRRRIAHGALAVAHDDPDRVAWHRAASTEGPDDEIAKSLVAAAERSRHRGATAEAVSALERAADFSRDSGDAGSHLVHAAEVAVELGQPEVVQRLLERAESCELTPLDRARAQWRRTLLDDGTFRDPGQVRAMVRLAVEHAQRGDPDAALDALVTIALTGWWTNFDEPRRQVIRDAVREIDVAENEPRRLAVLGFADPAASGGEVLAALADLDLHTMSVPDVALIGAVASILGDPDYAADVLEFGIRGARHQGRVNTLSSLLANRATNAWRTGEWTIAGRMALEAERLGAEVGRPANAAVGALVAARLAAMRGDADAALAVAAEVERRFRPLGAVPLTSQAAHVRGLVALVAGDADEAWDHLRPLVDPSQGEALTLLNTMAIDAAIDAAAAADERAPGTAMVDHVELLAHRMSSPELLSLVAYGRAILSDPDDVGSDGRFSAARALISSSSPLTAKLDLAHGIRLRRTVGPTAARPKLRAARDSFEALGAMALEARSRQELRAAGESPRARAPDAAQLLTPQELEIAVLAAAGMTNREIGRQLFLSHRTVGSHLYRTFPKLGITSRAQLRAVLGESVDVTR